MYSPILLSICITTYKRGGFITETLDSILPQLKPNIELIVVDGCSPDRTEEIMREYVAKHPEVKYYRESENSGIDKDYDKAVGYAQGQYCWLMTDDDLIKPNALNNILPKLDGVNDLVVVNAEVATLDFSKIINSKLIKIDSNQSYSEIDNNKFMAEAGHGLSFIGCVIIKREAWLNRVRSTFYGTLFIHVGVIFQKPFLSKICLVAEPLVTIRYGNAMWTPRGVEIWLFKWPNLIWSFEGYTDEAKSAVCPLDHTKKLQKLFLYKATGAYNYREYVRFFAFEDSLLKKAPFLLISIIPTKLANILASLYCLLKGKSSIMSVYSLNGCKYKNKISKLAARILEI